MFCMKYRVNDPFNETKGKSREMTGEATDNPEAEARGDAEKMTGLSAVNSAQRQTISPGRTRLTPE
jgi:uncharacterized protein YjbJ (UPF0337 family)